jgi:hypothetical protein
MKLATGFLLTLALTGCGLTAAQVRDRELCYTRAESAAQRRVDLECRGSFLACPAADGILADLRRAQEACP